MRPYVGARGARRLFILCAAGVAALLLSAASAAAFFHASSHPAAVGRISTRAVCDAGFTNPAYPNRNYTGGGCGSYTVQARTFSSSYTFPSTGFTVEALITAGPSATLTVPANTQVSMEYDAGGPTYGAFDIQGTLAVQSGVSFTFTSDPQGIFTVENGGLLDMSAGTSGAPIYLTSSSTTPGDWEGLLFLSGSNGTLNNVKVLYAGNKYDASSCTGDPTVEAAIFTCGGSPDIENSAVKYAGGNMGAGANGIEIENPTLGSTPTLSSDLISDNYGVGLQYDLLPNTLANDTNLTIVHNLDNTLYLTGGTWNGGALAPNHVLQNVGAYGYPVTISVHGNLKVGSSSTPSYDTAVVGAGTTLDFVNGGTFTDNGVLDMSAGTQSQPIVLTDSTPGSWWGGLVITTVLGNPTAQASLDWVSEQFATTGISITRATPTISNTVIDQSEFDAIDVHNTDGTGPTLTNVQMSHSGDNPLTFQSPPTTLDGDTGLNMFQNGDNRILITTNAHPHTGTGTWPNFGVPYDIEGNLTIQAGGGLTVGDGTLVNRMNGNLSVPAGASFSTGAGTTIEFAHGSGDVFYVGGTLSLVGTDDSTGRVTLTSDAASPNPGDWAGLQTRSNNTTLTHVLVDYAGASTTCCLDSLGQSDGIYVLGATPTFQNTTVTNSLGNGIEVRNHSNTTPTLTNDTITWNGNYAIYYDYMASDLSALTGLSIHDNIKNRIYVAGGYQHGTGTWPNFTPNGGPLVSYEVGGNMYVDGSLTLAAGITVSPLSGDLFVDNGGSLAAGAGATIAFDSSGGATHTLSSDGTLDLSAGTATAPIILTSTGHSPGSWEGVQLYNGPSNFNYVKILYAGAPVGGIGQFGLLVGNGGQVNMTNSTIRYSAGDDVRVLDGSNANFDGYQAANYFGTVPPGFYGMINLDSNNTVDATYNYWDSPYGPYNATMNPGGIPGTQVSSYVNIVPWSGLAQAVTNLQGTPGNASVTVTWSAPSYDGDSAIDKYDISITKQGGGSVPSAVLGAGCTSSTGFTCTITGLANGTAYTVHVRAHNTYGDGADSSVNILTLPGAPSSLSATHGDTTAAISFKPPTDVGTEATITDYYVVVTRDSDSSVAFTAHVSPGSCGATCSVNATGLTNGTLYDVSVQAKNASGYGLAATTTVTPSTKPGIPTNLTYTPQNGAVTLHWTAPDNGGASLDYYSVSCTDGTNTYYPSGLVSGSATSATVSGLTNGTTYSCSVTAHNLNGYGPTATITGVQPNPPASITIVGGPNQTVEYADSASITVNASDTDGDNVTMGIAANCGGGSGTNCLPNGLTATINNNGTQNPSISITGADSSPKGVYTVQITANDGYATVQKNLYITVNPEPGYITILTHPALITAPGGSSGAFSLSANVKDTSSDATGNLANAGPLKIQLSPVGPFGSATSCNATVPAGYSSSGSNASCGFNHVQPGVYEITVTAQGDYYQGNDHGIITVYDPASPVVAGTEDVNYGGNKFEVGFFATKTGGLKGGMIAIKYGSTTFNGGSIHADTVVTNNNSLTSLSANKNANTMTMTGSSPSFTLQIPSYHRLSFSNGTFSFPNTAIAGGAVFLTNQ